MSNFEDRKEPFVAFYFGGFEFESKDLNSALGTGYAFNQLCIYELIHSSLIQSLFASSRERGEKVKKRLSIFGIFYIS